jgi:hypothetical protein
MKGLILLLAICSTAYGPYKPECPQYDPSIWEGVQDVCDKRNPYARLTLACYDEVIPQSNLSPYDPDYPLPFVRYYEGYGEKVEKVDYDQAVEHYKACRRHLGNVLGAD